SASRADFPMIPRRLRAYLGRVSPGGNNRLACPCARRPNLARYAFGAPSGNAAGFSVGENPRMRRAARRRRRNGLPFRRLLPVKESRIMAERKTGEAPADAVKDREVQQHDLADTPDN